jgi:tRNA (guanine10-N2)-dimethyltransferase
MEPNPKEHSESRIATLFFVLSGEHPTLPFSELKSILEAEDHKYQVLERLTQVLRVKTNANSINSIVFRAAMTGTCVMELFNCSAVFADILEKMRNTSLEEFIKEKESFVARVHRIRGSAPQIIGMELERRLGGIIFNRVKGVKVSLKNPQKTFLGILTENKFVFGLKMAEISPKTFVERRPRNKPFFHPSAMPAKLARCMVNLAKPKAEDLVLDPFCGTATLLIEAGLIGCRVMGMDVQRYVVRGGLRNLLYYNVKPEGMVVADAARLPIAKANCIVTDPPYGRSTVTLGRGTKLIVEDFLSAVRDMLPRGRRICIASPKSVRVGKIGEDLGFKHVESHFAYVHGSLTREIAVFEGN